MDGNQNGHGFQPLQTTIWIRDQLVAGRALTLDVLIAEGIAVDRREAIGRMQQGRRYARHHNPEVPIGFLPGQNGNLGTHQRLNDIPERLIATRLVVKRAEGYLNGAGDTIENAAQELPPAGRAVLGEGLLPSVVEIYGAMGRMAHQAAMSAGDAKARAKLERNLRRLLKEGTDE